MGPWFIIIAILLGVATSVVLSLLHDLLLAIPVVGVVKDESIKTHAYEDHDVTTIIVETKLGVLHYFAFDTVVDKDLLGKKVKVKRTDIPVLWDRVAVDTLDGSGAVVITTEKHRYTLIEELSIIYAGDSVEVLASTGADQ